VANSDPPQSTPGKPQAELLGQWSVVQSDLSPQEQLDRLVMAWAKDVQTGEPRYILELDEQHRGAMCGCVCYSCGLPLTAVNAARKKFVIRPHFRHPDGAEKKDCAVLTARAAAAAAFGPGERIMLPAKRFGAHVIGLSGQRYEAWVTKPREAVSIRRAQLRDQVTAVLTLDDGREVLVRLTGSAGTDAAGALDDVRPVIQIEVEDSQLASLNLQDLKTRLHLLLESGSWCGQHWDDEEQTKLALAQAQERAGAELDTVWPDAVPELGESPSRESFLHWLAKQILLREKRLMVPPLVYQGESTGRPFAAKAGVSLHLSDVRLEHTFGAIRPDVLAKYLDPTDETGGEILIEVTVTNMLTPERKARIASEGVAALEIDLSSLGGALTQSAFARLLVDEVTAKRWIFHPWTAKQASEEEKQKERRKALPLEPLQVLVEGYLASVEEYVAQRRQDDRTVSWEVGLNHKARDVEMYGTALGQKGYTTATAEELYRWERSILERLITIRKAVTVGCSQEELTAVFDSLVDEESAKNAVWSTVYLIAHKVYSPKLAEEQEVRVQGLRLKVRDSLRAGESAYRRPRRHDELIGLLFPEMADALRKPLPGENVAFPDLETSAKRQSFNVDARPERPTPVKPWAQGSGSRPRKSQDEVWLTGIEYERWKKANPKAAETWEASRRHAGDNPLR
jgi:hypothetical protein